jgi:hypothetical protein
MGSEQVFVVFISEVWLNDVSKLELFVANDDVPAKKNTMYEII